MRHASLFLPSVLGLVAIGALTGCPDRTISKVVPEQGRVEYKDIPVTVNRNIDILFVIDDSGSMRDKQENLKANFPAFIAVLNTITGGLPDVHIGVVSSDMGTKPDSAEGAGPQVGSIGMGGCAQSGLGGALQTGQATTVTGSFIRDIKQTDGSRMTNYTGDLATVFGDLASIGDTGCGFEQHLHAMKAALNNNPSNTGFIRADAFLAVIFIADEDDCSMSKAQLLTSDTSQLGPLQSFRCTRYGVTCDVGGQTEAAMNQLGRKEECHSNEQSPYMTTVKSYADFLKTLKPDAPEKLIVAGILGLNIDPNDEYDENTPYPFDVTTRDIGGQNVTAIGPACSYQGRVGPERGDPATRIMEFLQYFPNRNTAVTICQPDLSGGLTLIAELLKTAIGNPCIEGQLADVDPETAGVQVDCSVSYVQNLGKPNQTETILPQCNDAASNTPCWRIGSDPMGCPTSPNNQVLETVDPNTPPPETHIIANCVTVAK